MRPASADRKVGALPSILLALSIASCMAGFAAGHFPSILLAFDFKIFLSPKYFQSPEISIIADFLIKIIYDQNF